MQRLLPNSLCLVFAVCAVTFAHIQQTSAQTLDCDGSHLTIDGNRVSFQTPKISFLLSNVAQVISDHGESLLTYFETAPGTDDERITTQKYFRLNIDTGHLIYYQHAPTFLMIEAPCRYQSLARPGNP